MPIYEYQCTECQRQFEELVRNTEAERTLRCPHCGGRKVSRRLSTFAAHAAAVRPAGRPAGGPCGQCGSANGSCPFGE